MLKRLFEKIIKGEPLSESERIYFLEWAERADASNTDAIYRIVDNYIRGHGSINQLGDITQKMGLVNSGEFRSGNDRVPGDGFTGGRFGYPGFTYGGTEYFLAGVLNDVLQVGLALASGKVYFGAGNGWLDNYGLNFKNQYGWISFEDTNGDLTKVLISIASDNFLVIQNSFGSKGVRFAIDDAAHDQKYIQLQDNGIVLDPGMSIHLGGGADDITAGWIPQTQTWTRTGNHSFTVAGNVTTTYRKGAKIRYSDGGSDEFGVIASSSYSSPNTTVNLIPNTDYAMAAATIADKYLSYIANPEGFPSSFNFAITPGYTGGTTDPTSLTIQTATWNVVGTQFFVSIRATLVRGTGNRTNIYFPMPVTVSIISACTGMDGITAAGLSPASACYFFVDNRIYYQRTMANDGDVYATGSIPL